MANMEEDGGSEPVKKRLFLVKTAPSWLENAQKNGGLQLLISQ
jgi:hypothetical protein